MHHHAVTRCCDQVHTATVGDRAMVRYVVRSGRVFLEKCGAFLALGRLFAVRCSDYRRCDRLLTASGLRPGHHFLFENQATSVAGPAVNRALAKRRNRFGVQGFRRTHVSLDAMAALVARGFVDPSKVRLKLTAYFLAVKNSVAY